MTEETCPPVSVSRTIGAPADKLFSILARPARHPLIDGSGMVVRADSDAVLSGVGDVFDMKMHNDEMGEYEMTNCVFQYELNRQIGWEPALKAASRDEDQEGIGDPALHRWAFDLLPVDAGSTLVTETYDCSRSPEWLRKAVRGGERWRDSMTLTLEKLDVLSRNS
ncbi:MAG TPA: hypothetical protein VME19_04945 [Streptosporangiaceae bacterium]|nr:hypothetical protein [Streptosporangiaceae bacterium]